MKFQKELKKARELELRDEFAKAALIGILTHYAQPMNQGNPLFFETHASYAYCQADAMLEARKK